MRAESHVSLVQVRAKLGAPFAWGYGRCKVQHEPLSY